MRLNEFKYQYRIDEVGRLGRLFGASGAARIKQLGNRLLRQPEGELSTVDKTHKENFFNNLFSAVFKSLNSEIASGRVDPSIKSTEPVGDASQDAGETPAAASDATAASPAMSPATPPSTEPKKAPGNAPAPGQAQRQTSRNINNYIQSLAKTLNSETDKSKKIALAKELVNFLADRKGYPEWENAVSTAQMVIKKGVPDPYFNATAINRLKAGQMMEAFKIYWINKLLEAANLSFKDIGLVLLKENKKNGKYALQETKYYKLNTLFESFLVEAESVEQWFYRFLPNYLRDNGMAIQDTYTQSLIRTAANAYNPKNTGPFKKELEKLTNALFAAQLSPGYGAGGPDKSSDQGAGQGAGQSSDQGAGQGAGQSSDQGAGQPKKTGMSTDKIVNSLQSLLAKLKGIDPALHAEIVKKIGAGASLQGLPGLTPPSPTDNTPAVSESKIIKKSKK